MFQLKFFVEKSFFTYTSLSEVELLGEKDINIFKISIHIAKLMWFFKILTKIGTLGWL